MTILSRRGTSLVRLPRHGPVAAAAAVAGLAGRPRRRATVARRGPRAHPAHRAKIVTQFVASTDGRLRLFVLPAYSPQLNPDERVWNTVKHDQVGRTSVTGLDDFKAFGGRTRDDSSGGRPIVDATQQVLPSPAPEEVFRPTQDPLRTGTSR
jgi:hypothetical protein